MTHFNADLAFSGGAAPELLATRVVYPSRGAIVQCTRGRWGSLYRYGTFQWTNAVKALCVLLAKLACLSSSERQRGDPCAILGGPGSLALSLDYALSKRPLWLADMFGVDANGNPHLTQSTVRLNSGLRRTGPVIVGLTPVTVSESIVRVVVDGKVVGKESIIEILDRLYTRDETPSSQPVFDDFNQILFGKS